MTDLTHNVLQTLFLTPKRSHTFSPSPPQNRSPRHTPWHFNSDKSPNSSSPHQILTPASMATAPISTHSSHQRTLPAQPITSTQKPHPSILSHSVHIMSDTAKQSADQSSSRLVMTWHGCDSTMVCVCERYPLSSMAWSPLRDRLKTIDELHSMGNYTRLSSLRTKISHGED